AGMSPLGIGTDIGGSIRIPAHFSGICGLKPTLDRWPNRGANTALAGQEAVRGQIGPMARSARDLGWLMAALDPRALSALDPRVPPLEMADPSGVGLGRVRVGYYVEGGVVRSSRAVVRAVRRAAEALAGHVSSVAEYTPPGIVGAIEGYFAAL